MYACDRNSFKFAKLLIGYNADLNAQDCDGKTALTLASIRNLKMAKLLRDHVAK